MQYSVQNRRVVVSIDIDKTILKAPEYQGNLFFKFEPGLDEEKKKELVQNIAEMGKKTISAIELCKPPVVLNNENYDANVVFLDFYKQNEILDILKGTKGISNNQFYVKDKVLSYVRWQTYSECSL